MSAILEIRDGDPWYLSPDIWVVPGDDPEGSPGLPVAGKNAFVWCRVRNNGTSPVNDAIVNFYWANPSTGFDRNTAHPIGSAFVSIGAGENYDVLCLTPWVPEFVNDGHECVLAEAFHPILDPLPDTPSFNTPTDRHVAQRNLSVLSMAAGEMRIMRLTFFNTDRRAEDFEITVEEGSVDNLKPLVNSIPSLKSIPKSGKLKTWGFVNSPCASPKEVEKAPKKIQLLSIPANRSVDKFLSVSIDKGAALLHIRQRSGNRDIGGLSILVFSDDQGKAESTVMES